MRAATLALLLAAALPAAASAGVIQPVSVSKSANVPAGETRSLTLACPARAVALNAAATSSLDATDSIPGANARRWTFRFTAGATAREASAVLRCVRLQLPRRVRGVGLAVGTIIEPVFEVPAGSTQRLAIRCPRGELPTGWGLEHRGANSGLAIAGAVPSRRAWTFTVENTGASGAAGTLHVRCLERKQRAATGQRHAFSTRIASFSEQLDGAGTTIRSCRRSEYSVATGVALPAGDDILMTGTGPIGARGGEWTFAQPAGSAAVRTSIVCLARDTSFRR
ncbi:MAG: hypothetical protein QOH58_2418 [Thermoleophilaceae bacterium]|nr:hypothetical protein [Thermoleophilaceae bacterium]